MEKITKEQVRDLFYAEKNPVERACLAQLLYRGFMVGDKRADGGPNSGNWGHEGRPGERGGSQPGGGHQNNYTGNEYRLGNKDYNSWAKKRAAAREWHTFSRGELKDLPTGTKIYSPEEGCFTVKDGLAFHDETGGLPNFGKMKGQVRCFIPREADEPRQINRVTSPSPYAIPRLVEGSIEYRTVDQAEKDNLRQEREIFNNPTAREAVKNFTADPNTINDQLNSGDYTGGNKAIDDLTDTIDQHEWKDDTTVYATLSHDAIEKMFGLPSGTIKSQGISALTGLTGTYKGFLEGGVTKGTTGSRASSNKITFAITGNAETKAIFTAALSATGKTQGDWDGKTPTSSIKGKNSASNVIFQRNMTVQAVATSDGSLHLVIMSQYNHKALT